MSMVSKLFLRKMKGSKELVRCSWRIELKGIHRSLSVSSLVREESNKTSNLIKSKLMNLMTWYEEVIGIQEVRLAQNKVIEVKEKFMQIQEERRDAGRAVSNIQNKLKDIYSELDKTTRGEDRYVQLITEEYQILREEKQLMSHFNQIERQEREYFSFLSAAVTESHEKERAQAEKVKYWSIIGSVAGTILGILGSSINNHMKMSELRTFVQETVGLVNTKSGDDAIAALLNKQTVRNEEITEELKMLLTTLSSWKTDEKTITAIHKQNMLIQKNIEEFTSLLYQQTSIMSRTVDLLGKIPKLFPLSQITEQEKHIPEIKEQEKQTMLEISEQTKRHTSYGGYIAAAVLISLWGILKLTGVS